MNFIEKKMGDKVIWVPEEEHSISSRQKQFAERYPILMNIFQAELAVAGLLVGWYVLSWFYLSRFYKIYQIPIAYQEFSLEKLLLSPALIIIAIVLLLFILGFWIGYTIERLSNKTLLWFLRFGAIVLIFGMIWSQDMTKLMPTFSLNVHMAFIFGLPILISGFMIGQLGHIKPLFVCTIILIIVVIIDQSNIMGRDPFQPVLFENGKTTHQIVVGTYKDYYLVAPYEEIKHREYRLKLIPHYKLIKMSEEDKRVNEVERYQEEKEFKRFQTKQKTTQISYDKTVYEIRLEPIGPLLLP